MMNFIEIQMEQWTRKEHYEHYINHVRCSYSITVDVDITNLLIRLKERGLKAYPAQIFMLSTVANQLPEFRMTTNDEQRLGYWEVIDPVYTILNSDTETFSAVWTKHTHCFDAFYRAYLHDTAQYANGKLFPQEHVPDHTFTISSLPWLDFSAFNINVFSDGNYLLPIFTLGKFKEENGKTNMPLAIQCHHAVCDGYHVGKFVEILQQMATDCDKWL